MKEVNKGILDNDVVISTENIQKIGEVIALEIEDIQKRLIATETTRNSADDFIRDIKKYLNAPELSREMCYELIDRIIIGGSQSVTGKECEIEIVYKIDIVSVLRHKVKK